MAIKAGRVGVRKDQVDPYGRIIENDPSLVDSEEIVFDKGDAGTKAYLAQDISNKIAKALQTPAQAPADHKLVGIDSSGAQEQIGIGSGLTLEAGKLKASGGGTTTVIHFTVDGSSVTADLVAWQAVNAAKTGRVVAYDGEQFLGDIIIYTLGDMWYCGFGMGLSSGTSKVVRPYIRSNEIGEWEI